MPTDVTSKQVRWDCALFYFVALTSSHSLRGLTAWCMQPAAQRRVAKFVNWYKNNKEVRGSFVNREIQAAATSNAATESFWASCDPAVR
jgi:hypothetical protein